MTKPRITGYHTDPDNWWAYPHVPEITMDHEGISVPEPVWDPAGRMYERQRYLQPTEVDAFMRHHGMKRVYAPRGFRASPIPGKPDAYRITCRKCDTTTLTVNTLPHDSAKRHWQREHTQKRT